MLPRCFPALLSFVVAGTFVPVRAVEQSDVQAVKTVVVTFLTHLGEGDYEAIPALFAPAATISHPARIDGQSTMTTETFEAWMAARLASPTRSRFREPVHHFDVHLDKGLAFVRADASYLVGDEVKSNNLDYFTLIEQADEWKIVNASYVTMPAGLATRGPEGQRKADLGNGTYLNPIFAGDHPDPSILKDGADYYIVFSTFQSYPGLVLWHSRDLVNWQPLGPTLFKNIGPVWAPELIKHQGRYFIYIPTVAQGRQTNYVIWADNINGPWSEPIDLNVGGIDPGHAVGPDGRRYLFLSAGYRVELAADGLSVISPREKVYDGWRYPADWIVQGFGLEGPKLIFHDGYYHMISAQGGTAGPPTSHMVVSARSRSIDGPWENSPYNPIVRTQSADEKWWSKGHGTLVEGPDGEWYLVYHAYEKGFYTLGRHTLLEPVKWTDDGWFVSRGDDVAAPIRIPAGGEAVPHGFALSDDFSTNKFGLQWSFFNGGDAGPPRHRYEDGALILQGKGTSPRDCSPLWFVCGDQAYEVQVEMELVGDAQGGLLLFYNDKHYAGLGYSTTNEIMHREGNDRVLPKPAQLDRHIFIRLRNDRHIVTLATSPDGVTWTPYPNSMEVSGYHHNVAYGFLSLRPALYAAGPGEVKFRHFTYRALP